jgi:hypothetical protein
VSSKQSLLTSYDHCFHPSRELSLPVLALLKLFVEPAVVFLDLNVLDVHFFFHSFRLVSDSSGFFLVSLGIYFRHFPSCLGALNDELGLPPEVVLISNLEAVEPSDHALDVDIGAVALWSGWLEDERFAAARKSGKRRGLRSFAVP